MTVKKISDSDKQEILDLYRQTGETTSTLAERYGVSNSTISRLLKSTLPEDEYETLIQQKRAARFSVEEATPMLLFSEPEFDVSMADSLVVEPSPDADKPSPVFAASQPEIETPARVEALNPDDDAPSAIELSSASSFNEDVRRNPVSPPQLLNPQPLEIELRSASPFNEGVRRNPVSPPQLLNRSAPVVDSSPSPLNEDSGAQANALAEMLGEELLYESEDLTDLDDDDLEDLDEDDLDEDTRIITRRVPAETLVRVLPLSEATLPKTCYLVIDRASELITRPLRDFGDLGQIPTQEIQQKTLPVFDNHRVARRFSTKRDRVIKVPDSRLLQKTRSQLQAKGITRLLVDGQVYSLSK